jgi:hypothetical protein
MLIKLADDAIRDARLLIAELDLAIAEMEKNLRVTKKGHLLLPHLRGELSRLRCERARLFDELQDLLQLAEMPPEEMGSA